MKLFKQHYQMIFGLITIGILIGIVFTTSFNLDKQSRASDGTPIYTESENTGSGSTTSLTAMNFNPNNMFVDIVEKVRPSIVSIFTAKNVTMQRHPLFEFFHDERFDRRQDDQEFKQQGLGSGILISKDGYIITNNHVVSEMDELRVQLVDNTEYEAELIGADPTTDIALIKIDAENLPFAVLGNSDNINIGEWVMAIGSPLYLTSTVTAGIVSALSRDINIIQGEVGSYGIENFIQTDAAINPGNSGGALVNLRGEVIGVNTAIASRTNYYMGYGFAVPINIAKSVVDDLRNFGEVRRGYLGVYIEPMNAIKAKGVNLDKPRGVFISSVIDGKAGDKAGLREGDVVLTVNGKIVNQPNQLQATISKYNPGDRVELEIWRDGDQKKYSVTLESQDDEGTPIQANAHKPESKALPDLGFQIRDMNNRQLDRLDLENGIVVTDVKAYSAAAKAGIIQNDVIYELENNTVGNVASFNDELENFEKGDVIRLKVRRKMDNTNFDRLVFVEIPEK